MKKRDEGQTTAAGRTAIEVLLGAGVGLAVSMLTLLLAGMGIHGGWIPENWMDRAAIAACAVGASAGGYFMAFRRKGHTPAMGAAVGVVLFGFVLTVGFLTYPAMDLAQGGIGRGIGCLCGGILSGLLPWKRSKKGRPSSRRRSH